MKISKREQFLILILSLALLVYGYNKYVFIPQNNKINLLRDQYNKINENINTAVSNSIQTKNKGKEIDEIVSRINEKTKDFYPVIIQENIIMEMDELLKKSKVESSISFNELGAYNIGQAEGVQQNTDANSANSESSNKALFDLVSDYNKLGAEYYSLDSNMSEGKDYEKISINISLSGSHDDMINFLKSIEEHFKKVYIRNLSISNGDNGSVTMNLDLEFVAIPKITEDSYNRQWNESNVTEELNSFNP